MGSINIAQISDIHINKSGLPVNEIFIRQNFLRVLNGISQQNTDLMVLTGDLAYREKDKDYRWTKERLDSKGIPYLLLSGNHDVTTEMIGTFGLDSDYDRGYLFYHKEINGLHLICLDSSKAYVPRFQLDWLFEESSKIKGEVLLFIHHPPYYLIAFIWIENIHNIFYGHYHTAKTVISGETEIYLAPSTYFQISDSTNYMKIESLRPGWRQIEWDGINIDTWVNYL